MPTDIAITRLLYAMLSQKNLKDIDWNKVAQDPVLAQEITNGHAARMRYSRFKKQMDGTVGIVKRPRKPRAQKTPSPKKNGKGKAKEEEKAKEEKLEPRLALGKVKRERDTYASSGAEASPEPDMKPALFAKSKDGLPRTYFQGNGMLATPGPSTPGIGPSHRGGYSREQSLTPSPNNSFGSVGIDELWSSFGMEPSMYSSPVMSPSITMGDGMPGSENHGMNMNMHAGLGDPYQGMWGGHEEGSVSGSGSGSAGPSHLEDGDDVLVKHEPRWGDGYRHL